jgi:hypothetical protein
MPTPPGLYPQRIPRGKICRAVQPAPDLARPFQTAGLLQEDPEHGLTDILRQVFVPDPAKDGPFDHAAVATDEFRQGRRGVALLKPGYQVLVSLHGASHIKLYRAPRNPTGIRESLKIVGAGLSPSKALSISPPLK